jgi:tripartite-type tricarboxylate transporter receptor subunit TctC
MSAAITSSDIERERMRRHILQAFVAAILVATFPVPSSAESWPTKPIRIIVPVTAGGDVDFVARLVGKRLSDDFKQPVIIDNRPGAGTQIATDAGAKAAPNGYTFVIVLSSHLSNPALYPKLPYDTVKDFEPVGTIVTTSGVVVVPAALGIDSLRELVAWSKAHPGKLNYATGSVADIGHITGSRLSLVTGMDAQHVPYKGASAALTDLLGGQINMMIATPSLMLPHIRSGKLKALAVISGQRVSVLPEVPTIAEVIGDKSFDMSSFYGLLAPAGTPADIVERMSAEVAKIIHSHEITEVVASRGLQPVGSTPQELKAYIAEGLVRTAAIIRQANIKPE